VPYRIPPELDGTLFTLYSTTFPVYRGFMLLVAACMLVAIYALLRHTRIGLTIQAALTHPQMAEALGHNVPRVFMLVFGGGLRAGGAGRSHRRQCLCHRAGHGGGGRQHHLRGSDLGGLGSLAGAFIASMLIGLAQTFAVALDYSPASVLATLGVTIDPGAPLQALLGLSIAQVAPILPYLLLIVMLIVRPKGLMGTREG